MLKAITKLAEVAKACGIKVRQSYKRVAKEASIMVGRYVHARQMKRAKKKLKFIRTRLKRLSRDVRRKAEAQFEDIPQKLKDTLKKADHIAKQKRGDPDYLYAWHAPEVECISKGKARKPYEFGCKVSIATQLHASKGGKHFILGAQALHGRPYDGHTLGKALDQLEEIIGRVPEQSYVDKGYKGHGCQERTRVYMSGQKKGVTQKIKRNIKRRSVIEPIIGHAKNDGHLGRHWLKGKKGDQLNTLFSAVGFNLRQLLSYLDDQRHLLPA
jgi:IS5 family transposase